MRLIKLFAMTVPLVGLCCFGQVSSNTAANKSSVVASWYAITVAPPVEPIHLGSPINVTVTVTNISGKEMYWESFRGKDAAYMAFHFSIAKDGSEVETSVLHRRMRGTQRPDDPQEVQSGSFFLYPVGPGKSFTLTVDLKRLYQVAEPGLYTLEVSRIEGDNITVVRAKPVTLKVGS